MSHQNIPGNALGRTKTDNMSQMITITDDFDSHQHHNEQMGSLKSDHIKRLPLKYDFFCLVHFSREFSTSRFSREVQFLTRNENETRSRRWLLLIEYNKNNDLKIFLFLRTFSHYFYYPILSKLG